MKSTKASAITSTLSPHAEPFFSRRFCSSAVEDSSFVSSPVDTYYSSPFQPQVSYAILENYYESPYIPYHFSGEWAPAPVSTSPSPSYPSPNAKLALSPCLTLKKLEFACDPTSKLSSDDPSLIDSPCYKGRNWSQTTPHHIGETSAPLLVTVEKLREEHNLSIVETPIARLMVSDEKEKGLSVPVPAVPLDSGLEIGSSREEMLLQKIVDLSDMLLQIPSNAADLAQGNYKKVKMIIEDLEKLMEKSKKGNLSKHTRAYRLDKEKGKEHTYSQVYPYIWANTCIISHNLIITSSSLNIASQIFRPLRISRSGTLKIMKKI
ncbi:uncharacterized protein LOC144567598 isoform X3 [Carex rostrata]